MRSAAKPFQLLPLLLAGGIERYGLEPADLAIMAGSHDGTDAHAARAESILRRMGLEATALRCGVQRPYYLEDLALGSAEQRREFGPLHNNCSGNHAAMLGLALAHGVPLGRYLDPSTEGQRRVHALLQALAGVEPYIGIDDCGAPSYALPLAAMAEAYLFLAKPALLAELGAERRAALGRVGETGRIVAALESIAAAMACEPQWVSGEGTDATRLAALVPGEIIAKHGAEGVLCVAHRGRGAALALKVADGDGRALMPALLRLQVELGWMREEELTPLIDVLEPPRLGRSGQVVGRLRVASLES
jgi:L-asparaginase II